MDVSFAIVVLREHSRMKENVRKWGLLVSQLLGFAFVACALPMYEPRIGLMVPGFVEAGHWFLRLSVCTVILYSLIDWHVPQNVIAAVTVLADNGDARALNLLCELLEWTERNWHMPLQSEIRSGIAMSLTSASLEVISNLGSTANKALLGSLHRPLKDPSLTIQVLARCQSLIGVRSIPDLKYIASLNQAHPAVAEMRARAAELLATLDG